MNWNEWFRRGINHNLPSSSEILDHKIDMWDERITEWEPDTAWDAANQRSLICAKVKREKVRKAACRAVNKEKEITIEERRQQRLKELEFECYGS